ncbi:MAG: hypothetical protein HY687_01325 [Chloroflexi bacterium]|nr:hypothetical protein [Chloroflexota bacterium]
MKRPLDAPPGRLRYRVGQFLEAVNPARPELDGAAALLSPAQRALFRRLRPDAQRHCLAVFWALVEGGERDPDVLLAALLHDAGKEEVAVAHRVAAVLLGRLWPGLLERLARPGVGPLWGGLHRNLRHARRGAELAAAAGATAGAVALIRAHHDPDPGADPRLGRLQAADGQG